MFETLLFRCCYSPLMYNKAMRFFGMHGMGYGLWVGHHYILGWD